MNNPETAVHSKGFKIYLNARVVGMLLLGFSAGLPLLLVGGTFSAWLRDLGLELAAIGFLSWVGMAHSIKILWAPVVDRMPLPLLTRLLGRRRSWMFTAQLMIAAGLAGMSFTDPLQNLGLVAVWAIMAAFGSATQDVAIDAYRVEAAPRHMQAAMAASYVTGYRVAVLAAGAGALHLATVGGWQLAYGTMALLMAVGMITTLVSREPEVQTDTATLEMPSAVDHYLAHTLDTGFRKQAAAWLIGAVVMPLVDFFRRYGLTSIAILAFVATFRISDIFMGVMANPFYLDLGFSKQEIANIAAAFGLVMTLAGAAAGGILVARYGIAPLLVFTAFMAPATNITFSWLAVIGPERYGLIIAIMADNVTGGMATAVFIAYLSSLTKTAFTATQYALLSSLMTLPGQFAGGFTGLLAANVGWVSFFLITAAIGLPAILLVLLLLRIAHPDH